MQREEGQSPSAPHLSSAVSPEGPLSCSRRLLRDFPQGASLQDSWFYLGLLFDALCASPFSLELGIQRWGPGFHFHCSWQKHPAPHSDPHGCVMSLPSGIASPPSAPSSSPRVSSPPLVYVFVFAVLSVADTTLSLWLSARMVGHSHSSGLNAVFPLHPVKEVSLCSPSQRAETPLAVFPSAYDRGQLECWLITGGGGGS